MKRNYSIASNIMSIQRNLLALPTMNFLSSAPPPTFLPSYMTQKVILIALQKQIRKRDEIVILSQVSPANRYIRTSMVFL